MRVMTRADKLKARAKRTWSAMWKRLGNWAEGYERKHIARRAVVVFLASPCIAWETSRQVYHTIAECAVELYQYIRYNN